MKSNYSDIPHHVLEACKVPDLMHTKVGEILKFEKKQQNFVEKFALL